jgi:prepilin-type N-terminal cleavage/methylation domain-containing protein
MRKFKAFSLIEMLMTLGIMSIVVLIATQTLNTVFRVSTISKFKTVTRSEISFSMELVERLLSNSNVRDVYIYNPTPDQTIEPVQPIVRYYNEETNTIDNSPSGLGITYDVETNPGDSGTEIHIRPYGYDMWVCVGYFVNEEMDKGYLLKRTVDELDSSNTDHSSCFNSGYSMADPILVLNSEDVNVNDFVVSYAQSSDINNVFYVDMEMEPTSWAPGESAIERAVIRQAIVTTKGLTWY